MLNSILTGRSTLQQVGLEARQAVQMGYLAGRRDYHASTVSANVFIPLLASGLANLAVHQDASFESPLDLSDFFTITSLSAGPAIIKEAGSFIAMFALQCATINGSNSAISYLQTILGHLSSVPVIEKQLIGFSNLLREIQITAAFGFCDREPRVAHVEWAMALEQTINLKSSVSATPDRKTLEAPAQYRWEEGISEWAKRTPIALSSKTIVSPFVRCAEDRAPIAIGSLDMKPQAQPEITPEKEIVALPVSDTTDSEKLCVKDPAKKRGLDIQDVSRMAPDKFHMVASVNDSDSDELSILDSSLQCNSMQMRQKDRTGELKLRQSFKNHTQAKRSAESVSGKTPWWVRKRTSLGFKEDAESTGDELGE